MFVAKWQPGLTQMKLELTSAPVWLELRNVPLHNFNSDGLEYIAGQVGHHLDLHPSIANLTNLEVAKVLTIIDPRKPLPEAVNVNCSTGEIVRILTSSPWMPPICSHCKGICHNIKLCPSAPITCTGCSSTGHNTKQCPRARVEGGKNKTKSKRRASKEPPLDKAKVRVKDPIIAPNVAMPVEKKLPITTPEYNTPIKLVTIGESSTTVCLNLGKEKSPFTPKDATISGSGSATPEKTEANTIKNNPPSEDGNGLEDDQGFVEVVSKRQLRSTRGRGPKPT
ncbi:hypothetical protein V5N11_031370 [Cardamine amara subsp. amara]|uniref:CCHC-type domain-containing protein n=1 Tax=Cardamine amara subsp. amara TaxID=228776 RepID=A0ABD1AV80_CARAN